MSETAPICFFLGANSPQGFVSRFDQLDCGDHSGTPSSSRVVRVVENPHSCAESQNCLHRTARPCS